MITGSPAGVLSTPTPGRCRPARVSRWRVPNRASVCAVESVAFALCCGALAVAGELLSLVGQLFAAIGHPVSLIGDQISSRRQ